MTRGRIADTCSFACAVLLGCAHVEGSGAASSRDAFDALVGTWSQTSAAGRTTTEEWVRPHPRLLLGTGTTGEGERRATAQLAIERRDDGAVYVAHPEGQPATALRRRPATDGLVFENPAHDFPRTLIYRRRGQGAAARLFVSVRGARESELRDVELALARQPDPPRPRDIVKTRHLGVPQIEVFAAFTSTAGVTSFLAPAARVEPRPWGAYELYFEPDAPEGRRGTEGGRIVELVENTRLAFTWSWVPTRPALRDARTLVTVALEPALDDHLATRLLLRQAGFRSGPEWEAARAELDRAWEVVLDRLERRFAEGPIDWRDDGRDAWRGGPSAPQGRRGGAAAKRSASSTKSRD